MRQSFCLYFWVGILLLASACSRYGLRTDGTDRSQQATAAPLLLQRSYTQVLSELSQWLEERGRSFSLHDVPASGASFLEQDWIRDSSLEYHYLNFDRRQPHLVQWKGVWRLKAVQVHATEIRLDILELVFMGPREAAPPTPQLDGQWLEAPASPLRAVLELRRFHQETYPQSPLPPSLGQITVPSLKSPPRARVRAAPPSKLSSRPRAF